MSWSMLSVRTLEGVSIGPAYPISGQWRKQVNGFGGGEHVFQLDDTLRGRGRAYWRDLFVEIRRMLAVSWDGHAVYAGVITGTSWNADLKQLTVTHQEGPRCLFPARLPFVREDTEQDGHAPSGSTAYWARSLRDIAREIVRRGGVSTDARRDLKIDLGPTFPAGTETREWRWWNFPTIEDMLSEVQNSEGGPDVAFEPEWRTDGLWHRLMLGDPHLAGDEVSFVRGVPGSPVTGYVSRSDALKQATTTWAVGEGSERDMLAEVRELPVPLDMPELDRVHSGYKHIADTDTLSATAAELAAAFQWPSEMRTFDLRIGDDVDPDKIRLGTLLNVHTPADEWEDAQWFEGRVVSIESEWGAGVGDVLKVGML